MQTTYTELSLESNEALSLASMVRQSCPTARLLGAKRIQNRKLWREYGSGVLLRLARKASSRGVLAVRCSYVHCRETHVRLTSDGGETNETLLFHGTGKTNPKVRAPRLRIDGGGQAPSVASGTNVTQEVVEHEQGLDSRLATGGFYGPATYLAEGGTYPIGGRYVRLAGLALKPRMHEARRLQVCSPRGGDKWQARAETALQLLVVRAALGT